MNLQEAQRRYQNSYDKRVNTVNQALKVGDWVYVDTHAKDRKKLDPKLESPYRIIGRDSHTFTVISTTMLHGPQEAVVPLDHEDTGQQFVSGRFVAWDRGSRFAGGDTPPARTPGSHGTSLTGAR